MINFGLNSNQNNWIWEMWIWGVLSFVPFTFFVSKKQNFTEHWWRYSIKTIYHNTIQTIHNLQLSLYSLSRKSDTVLATSDAVSGSMCRWCEPGSVREVKIPCSHDKIRPIREQTSAYSLTLLSNTCLRSWYSASALPAGQPFSVDSKGQTFKSKYKQ
jgi:hypothetical protein